MSIYNKENAKFLNLALESILNQTITPNEIIIVKDGPLTIELDRIIEKYKMNYSSLFKIITLDHNCGLGIALAKGVEASRYNLIARMDSDDIAVNNRFERQLLEFEKDDNLDLVGSDIFEFIDSMDNIISKKQCPNDMLEIKRYAKKRNPFNHMTVMFKKSAVISAGNYIDSKYTEDYYLWVRMLQNNSEMKNIPECLVYARVGEDMYKRRGGIIYIKSEIKLQRLFKKIKFINNLDLLINILTKSVVRLVPNKMRKYIYIKFLR